MIRTGLSIFRDEIIGKLSRKKLAVLCNQASVDENCIHILDIISESNAKLELILTPEHGLYSIAQDRVAVENSIHPKYNIPVISLYGDNLESLSPKHDVFNDIDMLIIDLQDIGARYYTFVWTASLALGRAAEMNTPVMVLDRPNPITGVIEGPMLEDEFTSFVGLYPIPARHGMTIAEILSYVNINFSNGAELEIVKMKDWQRSMWFDETGLPWIPTSPNMPTLKTATVYPGMCLIEGTNVSEGRGTTRPFEVFGAPFIDSYDFVDKINSFRLEGVKFLPWFFEPKYSKYAGKTCGGALINVIQRDIAKPVLTGFAIVKAIFEMYPDEFEFSQESYEFVGDKLAFDVLAGSDRWRNMIVQGAPLEDISIAMESELSEFNDMSSKFKLY